MKKKAKKILIYSLLIIIVLIIAFSIFIYSFSHSSLPKYQGTFKLKGLKDTVYVYRDSLGVPHIYAKNDADLYRVFGYVSAQERLWQMDLIRRVTQGRISEIFGKKYVDVDLKLRALRIEEKSQQIWQNMNDTLKNMLIAFSDGINQYIENNTLPIEFRILGYKPEKWTPKNSLNLIGYMAWDLGMAWSNEITLYKIKNLLGDSLMRTFLPNFNNDSIIYKGFADTLIKNIENQAIAFNSTLQKLGAYPFMASNNWVVAGSKSITGKPILCNDMHLGLSIPGIWMQAHLHSPDLNVTGVVVPGAPVIVAGHNDSIAWGMTNVMLDDADFYIETLNKDSTKYLVNGQWRNLTIKKYKIATKEGDTITRILRFTHRGPIISYFKKLNKALSMAWIGNLPSNEVKGLYIFNHAKNWNDFKKGAKYFGSVAQNIIYADVNGNIGIQMTGTIPIRKTQGWHIFPGDTTLYDWKNFISADSLPFVFNPKDGFLASANNKSLNNYKYYITQYYHQDYRFDRITYLLKSKDKLSVEDMKRIQNDIKSEFVKEYLPDVIFEIASNIPKNPNAKKALEILKSWDGEMKSQEAAPLIFEQFFILFVKNTIEDELGKDLTNQIFSSTIMTEGVIRNLWHDKFSPLYDNKNTKKKETFNDIVKMSFAQTIDTLEKQLGKNPEKWHYGDIHTITFEHPLAAVKILDMIFNLNRGPYAVGGSYHTVCPFSYDFTNNFKVKSGASERHIFDLSNWDNSQTVIPTGVSGQPASEFYCNQTQMYLKNKYHRDLFSLALIKKKTKYHSVFIP